MNSKSLKLIYNNSILGPIIFFVLLFCVPLVSSSNYLFSILTMVGFYALVCIGLTTLTGYAGQISLGHAAFYGIGAYSSAVLTGTYGLNPWVAIIIGAIISAVVALIVGIPTFKLKGYYLALATLGFGIIVYTLFKELSTITGGSNGFFGIPPISLFGFEFITDTSYFYLIWIFVFFAILFTRNIIHSRIGRGLRSIEGSEIAADAVGVNLMNYKLQIFVLSAIFASVSGSLLAHYVSFINPDLFVANTSIFFLIMVIMGGKGNIWGSIVGAAMYVLLDEILKHYVPMLLPNVGGQFEIVFFGILLVLTLIYMPDGLVPRFEKLISKFKKKTPTNGALQSTISANATGGDNK
ncbi:amino acid/amide ABC transporter membrane protein 2 (HAAT family) [Ureibacillus xyleni]|uniref:Amino acid/amide ABC transporter membrane protein 2 (HAAT family) n=1 Tax=Ureibacillus xyleni TaxID=614648 RepID=A0A285S0P1_9BACL|nr:branched-chain amino acid ABC transporter permease [Ureibacillus xyleni]SOB98446.1 amino acid/amide ABC transporter membrane protein 2 (HAAT family) [Ureibacillus xyleni]